MPSEARRRKSAAKFHVIAAVDRGSVSDRVSKYVDNPPNRLLVADIAVHVGASERPLAAKGNNVPTWRIACLLLVVIVD